MGVNGRDVPDIFYLVAIAIGVAALALLAGLVVWAVGRHYVWRLRRAVARKQAQRRKTRPDGLPYPPAGMGICSECEKAGPDVYHLPSGRRLCKDCYARIEGLTTDDTPRSRK